MVQKKMKMTPEKMETAPERRRTPIEMSRLLDFQARCECKDGKEGAARLRVLASEVATNRRGKPTVVELDLDDPADKQIKDLLGTPNLLLGAQDDLNVRMYFRNTDINVLVLGINDYILKKGMKKLDEIVRKKQATETKKAPNTKRKAALTT